MKWKPSIISKTLARLKTVMNIKNTAQLVFVVIFRISMEFFQEWPLACSH